MRDPVIVYLGFILLCYFQQVSPQQNGDLRLVGGSLVGQPSGRLEVYTAATDEWGTVCSSGFTVEAANTTCRQLGHAGAERYNEAVMLGYGVGNGSILFSRVTCDGNENHILRCDTVGYSSLASTCTHDQDVAIICLPEPAFQYEGGVRLVDGPYRSEGILEVFVYSRWYTLCAESLSPTAINTVCYQLGYTGSIGNNNRSSSSNSYISLPASDCVVGSFCFGSCYMRSDISPDTMQDCSSNNFYVQCGFVVSAIDSNPIGSTLLCNLGPVPTTVPQQGDLRLVDGVAQSLYFGRLEIYDSDTNQWGTICDQGFDQMSADTACKQLGMAGARRFDRAVELRYGPGTGPILLTQVQCDDDTNHILRCRVRGSSSLTSQCNHENDVGVICSRDAFQYEGGVRLVDGPYRSEGRVEVFIFNQWYTLCGATRVSQDVAAAVCRQLSYTHNDEASVVSLTNDVDFTWNTNLNCMFSTPCFSRCYQRPSSMERVTQFCSPATSIYVKCGFDLSISQITPIGTISQCMLSVPEDTDEEETSGGLSGGAVAGIVIGSFVIVGFIIFFIVNKDAQNKCRKAIEDVRARLRNYRNSITDSLRNCCNRSARNNTTSAPTTNEIPTGYEPTVSITPPHEDVTLTAVSHIPGTDANKPPDYNDALKYRKSLDEGYPEPSLVDQPPSYDSVN